MPAVFQAGRPIPERQCNLEIPRKDSLEVPWGDGLVTSQNMDFGVSSALGFAGIFWCWVSRIDTGFSIWTWHHVCSLLSLHLVLVFCHHDLFSSCVILFF